MFFSHQIYSKLAIKEEVNVQKPASEQPSSETVKKTEKVANQAVQKKQGSSLFTRALMNTVVVVGQMVNAVSNVAPEAWAKKVAEYYKIEPNGYAPDLTFSLDLPLSSAYSVGDRKFYQGYEYYVALQKLIASYIPQEHHRPTIDLLLEGVNAEKN